MPKVKWGIGNEEPEDLQSFEQYEGDTPPGGVYWWKVKKLTLEKNRNDDDMLKFLLIIDEPESSEKAKFNLYAMWVNFNVTEEGGPFIKRMLAAFGLKWSDFIETTVTEDEGRPTDILRIGDVKFAMQPRVKVATKRAKDRDNNTILKPTNWIVPKDGQNGSSEKPKEEAVFDAESDPDNPPF
jgi:hypothetical protein